MTTRITILLAATLLCAGCDRTTINLNDTDQGKIRDCVNRGMEIDLSVSLSDTAYVRCVPVAVEERP